jgi:hypothetical protein
MIRYGEYASKKARDDYGRELRKAHFLMGSKAEDPATTYKTDYLLHQPEGGEKGSNGGTKVVLAPRASHFSLGAGKEGKVNSSYSQDYAAKTAEKVALSRQTLADIRATHYALGHNALDYCSIQKRDYAPPQHEAKYAADSKEMTIKMRKHAHSFGTTAVPYQSATAAAFAGSSEGQPSTNSGRPA